MAHLGGTSFQRGESKLNFEVISIVLQHDAWRK